MHTYTLDIDVTPLQRILATGEVFISYKWEGKVQEFAEALAKELHNRKISYWKDDHRMIPGDNITKHVADGIAKCSVFVPILSKGYVSIKGEKWCQKECAMAADKKKIIVPIQWNDTNIPDDIELMIRPDTLRAKYDPGADSATCKKKIKEICDAVCAQVRSRKCLISYYWYICQRVICITIFVYREEPELKLLQD